MSDYDGWVYTAEHVDPEAIEKLEKVLKGPPRKPPEWRCDWHHVNESCVCPSACIYCCRWDMVPFEELPMHVREAMAIAEPFGPVWQNGNELYYAKDFDA